MPTCAGIPVEISKLHPTKVLAGTGFSTVLFSKDPGSLQKMKDCINCHKEINTASLYSK